MQLRCCLGWVHNGLTVEDGCVSCVAPDAVHTAVVCLPVGAVADMWPNRESADEEPDWVRNERRQFESYRDKNGDGRMDREEVQEWILPENFDHSTAESKHLIFETDSNKVGTGRQVT